MWHSPQWPGALTRYAPRVQEGVWPGSGVKVGCRKATRFHRPTPRRASGDQGNARLGRRRSHRGKAHEVGPQVEQVRHRHRAVGRVRECREVVRAARRDPQAHRVHEVDLAPPADAGLRVGGQVLRVEDAHGRREGPAPGGQPPVETRRAVRWPVAREAAARMVQRLTIAEIDLVRRDRRPGQGIGTSEEPKRHGARHREGGERREGTATHHCFGRRYFSWQPLQLPESSQRGAERRLVRDGLEGDGRRVPILHALLEAGGVGPDLGLGPRLAAAAARREEPLRLLQVVGDRGRARLDHRRIERSGLLRHRPERLRRVVHRFHRHVAVLERVGGDHRHRRSTHHDGHDEGPHGLLRDSHQFSS